MLTKSSTWFYPRGIVSPKLGSHICKFLSYFFKPTFKISLWREKKDQCTYILILQPLYVKQIPLGLKIE